MCNKTLKIGIVTGVVGIAVSVVLSMLASGMTMPLFQQSAALWKSWTAPEMWLVYIVPLWVGLLMALFYSNFDKKSHMYRNGLMFGLKTWLLVSVTGMAMTYSSMAVPGALVGLWLATGLVQYVIMGVVVAKMARMK